MFSGLINPDPGEDEQNKYATKEDIDKMFQLLDKII